MSELTEIANTSVTPEMLEKIEEAGKNGPYASKAEYVRSMIAAGQSDIAALDPRTADNTRTQKNIDSVEAAAKALDDKVLLSQLSDDKQGFDDIIQLLRQEFENVLANRLNELASDDNSAVETDGRGNYYLDT